MTIKVGIDSIAMYTSRYALDLAALANARGAETDKFQSGLGQYVMSVPPPGEDIVTMAANAAEKALEGIDKNEIEMLLFATESGIDQSKAAGLYVHELLKLPARCRVMEIKQACYGGTAGLQLALPFIRENPFKKVLVIASDIARYGLETTGESSQGAGAVAMVLSANPRILEIESASGIVSESVMDFWRPNYSHEAFVDGRYSSKLYLVMLEKCWEQYSQLSQRQFADHAYFCYHTPVPRLVEKAHQHLLKINGKRDLAEETAAEHIRYALEYGRNVGNSYTASLYVGLASLLDNAKENLAGKRIGFYSYGSGCVAEYFSGIVQSGYQDVLHSTYHTELLSTRKMLDYVEYAEFYQFKYAEDGSTQEIPAYKTGNYRLAHMQQHKRIYERVVGESLNVVKSQILHSAQDATCNQDEKREEIKIYAPGKLILSGEHAVVYGQPALAMAVNRYATATVSRDVMPQIMFDLSDLAHSSHLSFSALRDLKDRLKRKYHRFIRGDYSIRDVVQKPFELAQFALGVLADALNLNIPHGVKIQVQSDIPIGCGMGSSAATIISVMQAISAYMQKPLSKEALYQLALEAENMQHGRSSGLDLRIAMEGGCLYVHGEEIQKRALPQMPLYLVNTGTPLSTTGQCVEKVAPLFRSVQLQNDFAAVTRAMDVAIQNQSMVELKQTIKTNHRLLTTIGVVPDKVQQFILDAEAIDAAAKICGAGAIAGDQAGAVLVAAENKNIITALCARYAYNIIPIAGEARGVHAA